MVFIDSPSSDAVERPEAPWYGVVPFPNFYLALQYSILTRNMALSEILMRKKKRVGMMVLSAMELTRPVLYI